MDVNDFLKKDEFAALLGIELLEMEEGRAVAKLDISARHLNAMGIVQGGAIFTLADFALAAAANSYGNVAVSIHADISFLKAAECGVLYAEANEVSRNNKLAHYSISITNNEDILISTVQGMVFFKSSEI